MQKLTTGHLEYIQYIQNTNHYSRSTWSCKVDRIEDNVVYCCHSICILRMCKLATRDNWLWHISESSCYITHAWKLHHSFCFIILSAGVSLAIYCSKAMTSSINTFVVYMFRHDFENMEKWVLQYPDRETGGDLFGLWGPTKITQSFILYLVLAVSAHTVNTISIKMYLTWRELVISWPGIICLDTSVNGIHTINWS